MNNARVKELIEDSEVLYRKAIEEVERGEIRDECEKAWGAVVQSTNALILAKTGKEIEGTMGMSRELNKLADKEKRIEEEILPRYYIRESFLHGSCFYMGVCEPEDLIQRRIRETIGYIEDIKKLIDYKG